MSATPAAVSARRYPVWSALALLAAAALIFARNVYVLHLNIWDDAYITFRFARHFADGLGLVWNVGGARVEGFTSFLHVALIALAIRAGLGPELATLALAIASVSLTAIVIVRIVGRNGLTMFGVLGVALYLADPSTAVHATSGLETHLFAAALALSCLASLSFSEAPRPLNASALAAAALAAILTRPEGVLYVGSAYAVLAWQALRSDAPERHDRLNALALSAILLCTAGVAYAVTKYAYFGYLLPNPFYVKSAHLRLAGIHDVARYLRHLALLFGIPLGIAALAVRRPGQIVPRVADTKAWTRVLLIVAPPAVALAYYSTIIHEVGGDYRFSYPTLFYAAIAAGVALPRLAALWTDARPVMALAAACFAFVVLPQRPWSARVLPQSDFMVYHTKIAEALRATGLGPRAGIICDGAGIIPFSSEFRHVDRIGLTDNTLAGRKPMTMAAREAYIWSQHADVYLGYEVPASPGANRPEVDRAVSSPYVARTLLHHPLMTIEDRVFLTSPDLLHARMRELRDRWIWVGEIAWPGRDLWGLRAFVYVRRDSPYAAQLQAAFQPLLVWRPMTERSQLMVRNHAGQPVPAH